MLLQKAAFICVLAGCAISAQSPNYYSHYSLEISREIMTAAANDEYYIHLDYNGDNKLTCSDAVLVAKRYNDNLKNGNTIQFNSTIVNEIVSENYAEELIYYEIYKVNSENCRFYDIAITDISDISVYVEFSNFSDTIEITVDPFQELIQVTN